jgi:hypothetical protein
VALARAGKVTASRMSDVLSRPRPQERRHHAPQVQGADHRRDPHRPVARGRLHEPAIEAGIENEPFARATYEVVTGLDVDQVGFVQHPTIERSGCSPDGLVGTDGMVQIKCPLPHTHIYWMLGGTVPDEHEPQMHWEIDCCEREWSDFVSYCPVFPAPLNLFRCACRGMASASSSSRAKRPASCARSTPRSPRSA